MKKSVFNAAKLSKLSTVTRGTKSSNDVRPAITTGRAINKFTMNASASALIGCQHGDRVVMFAMPNADSINERFFIAISQNEEGCKLASAGNTKGVGRPQSFNYSGIWSQMLLQDVDAAPVGEKVLMDKGLMAEVETQKGRDGQMCSAILAVKRVEYGVELVVDDENNPMEVEIDGVQYDRLYVLTEPKDIAVDTADAETEATAEEEADAAYDTEEL